MAIPRPIVVFLAVLLCETIAAGLSDREIATELIARLGTVKNHINHIYQKLDVHSRTQAVVRARELDLA
jgi:LuxR family maltose regulon positive regulatory protein